MQILVTIGSHVSGWHGSTFTLFYWLWRSSL